MSKGILLSLIVINNIILSVIAIFYTTIKNKLSKIVKNRKIRIILYSILAIGIIIFSKYLSYEIEKYKTDSQLMFDFFNRNFKFLFNKGENPIISLAEYIVNISQSLEIYLGVISVLVAIYIYSLEIEDNVRKYLLLIVLDGENTLKLIIVVLLFYYFNISFILFFSLIFFIFYKIIKIIQYTFEYSNREKFKKIIITGKLIKRFIEEDREIFINIIKELKDRIYKALVNKEYVLFEENIYYFEKFLQYEETFNIEDYSLIAKNKNKKEEKNIFKEHLIKIFPKDILVDNKEDILTNKGVLREEKISKARKKRIEDREIIKFIQSLYIFLIKNPDDLMFETISYLNIELGEYYLKKNELKRAKTFYNFLVLKYKYLKNNKKDWLINHENIEENLFYGLRYYETYYKKLSEEQEIIILKSILNLFNEMIENDDIDDILKYQEIFTRVGERIENILLKEYSRVILIFLLEMKKESIKEDNKQIEKFNEIIKQIEYHYYYQEGKLLEELYDQSKLKDWERNFDIIDYIYEEPDIFGLSTGWFPNNCTRDIILRLMDKVYYSISDDFIIDNYEELEIKISELKLESLKSRFNELSDNIRMKKAERISKIQLTEEELTKIYSFVSEENSNFYKFLNSDLKYSFSLIFLSKKSEWEKDFKGYKIIYENRFIKNLIDTKSYLINSYVNLLNEFWFIECIKNKIKELKEIKEILELEKEKYFILSNNSNRRFLNKIGILTHYFSNWNMEKTYIINKNSIKEIIFYLPEGYDRLKYTYVEIESLKDNKDEKILKAIQGKTQEEKELIRQGSSILKVAKRMEIVFNDEVEIYEISNEKLKDEER